MCIAVDGSGEKKKKMAFRRNSHVVIDCIPEDESIQ